MTEVAPIQPEIADNRGSVILMRPRRQVVGGLTPMQLTLSNLVLRAKQLELEGVQHLARRIDLVDVIGQLIHALQTERGATSVYLASQGQQFTNDRAQALRASQPIETELKELVTAQLDAPAGATPRMLSLMAWVLIDLEALSALRDQIEPQQVTAHDSVTAFSRVIAGLLELIFHVADSANHPGISKQLVALVHLVQGKEAAGQERALGAQLFASGQCDEAEQQRVVHLIEAQERSLKIFEEFADDLLRHQWQQAQLTPTVALLERLRRTLCTARPLTQLDSQLSQPWFDAASERIAQLWQMEVALVQQLRQYGAAQIAAGEQSLQDSEGMLQQLRSNPPAHTHAVAQFFNAAEQPGAAPVLPSLSDNANRPAERPDERVVNSLVDMLQEQSARMARMETELESARKALHERKVIERAKGALMSRLGLTEEAAFRALQKASMDNNKRLVDVAEATLALPDIAFSKPKN